MEETLFNNEKPAITIVEFPLYIKNKKGTIYWRYHINGNYEMISFNKNNKTFTFGNNEYHKDYERDQYDNNFIIQQTILFEKCSEEEFTNKMLDFYELHQIFLGNKIVKKERQEVKEDDVKRGSRKQKDTDVESGGADIIIGKLNEEDSF